MVNNRNNGELKVETPSECSTQFDSIAYNKAGSVMMMIRAVLGEEQWQKGLTTFLNDNKYTSIGWEELLAGWDGMKMSGSDMSVRQAFEPYFLQMGYPVLLVDYDSNEKV